MTTLPISSTTSTYSSTQVERPRRHGQDPMLDTAAQTLGVSTADLKQQLASGKTLEDVASTQGVSKDDLVSAIAKDIQSHKPDGAPALSDDQATEMATNMVEGKKGPGGPDGQGQHGGPPPADATSSTSSTDATSELSRLAQALGLDQSSLLDQLSTGNTSSLQTSAWTADKSAGTGLLVDRYA